MGRSRAAKESRRASNGFARPYGRSQSCVQRSASQRGRIRLSLYPRFTSSLSGTQRLSRSRRVRASSRSRITSMPSSASTIWMVSRFTSTVRVPNLRVGSALKCTLTDYFPRSQSGVEERRNLLDRRLKSHDALLVRRLHVGSIRGIGLAEGIHQGVEILDCCHFSLLFENRWLSQMLLPRSDVRTGM